MAYERPFIRVTFGGGIADNNDIWSCGFALANYTETLNYEQWFIEQSANLATIGTLLSTFVSHPDTLVPNNAKLFWAKMALIGTDGKYMREAVETQLNSGGARNVAYSPQDALVIGLVSSKWKDPGKNNRFYLPTIGPSAVNAWKLTPQEQEGVVAQAVTLFNEINDQVDGGMPGWSARVGVVSDSGAGSQLAAQDVRVGAIVDTQRRRRNKLNEDYVVEPLGEF